MVSSCLSTVSAPLGSAFALLCSAVDVAFALMCSACAFKPLHCWRDYGYSERAAALAAAISLSTRVSPYSQPLRTVRAPTSSAVKSSLKALNIVASHVNMLCLRWLWDIPCHT